MQNAHEGRSGPRKDVAGFAEGFCGSMYFL